MAVGHGLNCFLLRQMEFDCLGRGCDARSKP
jgi:hypothetical protein